jgi:F0F1-type ATP synthase assembly protein I
MPEGPPGRRELGHYVAIAQVGMEMAAPIVIGLLLDYAFGWSPWGIVGGAVFGLIGGLAHLIALANRQHHDGPRAPQRDGK